MMAATCPSSLRRASPRQTRLEVEFRGNKRIGVLHDGEAPHATPQVALPIIPRVRCCSSFGETIVPTVRQHRGSSPLFALLLVAGAQSAAGCYMNGMGCQPGDSTETCCLKEHPGAWERCTGTAGPRTQPKSGNQPKPNNQPEPKGNPKPVSPPIPTPEEKQRWRESCRDRYAACKEFFAGEKQRRVWGESLCQSCMDLCMRDGQWPDEANDHPCPGG